jgi:hypothetical protein
MFNPPPKGTIFAKIRGDKFRLFAAGAKLARNDFAPYFYGSLQPLSDGTRIQGRFRTYPIVRISMIIWFGLLGLFTLFAVPPLLFGEYQSPQPRLVTYGIIAILLIILLFGIAVVRSGWRRGREQAQTIRDFLTYELLAKPEKGS